ncbi:GntR family transcriptional regulator [Streptomyces nigrescens]|uniref:GntR family transcriptional regulator n=1 Tax=Streptomyces nigrescens TaxID=1920 RepID=UPI0036F59EB0
MTQPPGAQPKYQHVLDQLREAIRRGDYGAAEPLPTEPELAKQHNVSLMTLRKALEMLKIEGVVEGRKGSGNYVRGNDLLLYRGTPHHLPHGAGRTPWDTRTDQTLDVDQITVTRKAEPPERVAHALDLESNGTTFLHCRRLLQHRRPVRLVRTHVPYGLVAESRLADSELTLDRLREVLARLGRGPARADAYIQSRPPTADEVSQLAIPPRRFVIHVHRTAFDASDLPVEVEETIMDSASYVLGYSFDL